MMQSFLTFLYTFLAAIAVMVLGWAIQIQPKISVLEQKQVDIKELLLVMMGSIDKRLERIERGLNGHLPKE